MVLCLSHGCKRKENMRDFWFLAVSVAYPHSEFRGQRWCTLKDLVHEHWSVVGTKENHWKFKLQWLRYEGMNVILEFFFPPQLCSSLSQKSGFNVCHQPEWHYESTSFYIVCLSVYISRIFNKGWDTCSRLSFPTDKNCSPACEVWIILFIDYWLNKIKFFRFFLGG